jgi:hypothetical protein
MSTEKTDHLPNRASVQLSQRAETGDSEGRGTAVLGHGEKIHRGGTLKTAVVD